MKEIKVDWNELELAFREISGTKNYIDVFTGAIVSVVPGFEDEEEVHQLINQNPHRLMEICPLDANFGRAVLRRFIQQNIAPNLRNELTQALEGPAGLTYSMNIIKRDGESLSHYHRFEQELFWEHVHTFLVDCGILPTNRAPQPELFYDVA
jgi:hypothetical protein